ncbi:MAG: accessory gene regulator B family protein [Syntrophomonadaceae bacterium]|nr:accessory gene regulator B family protein [Syntrophomonadaceae bacterium]
MSYLEFSRKWASSLAAAHQLDEEKQAELAYAIEVLAITFLDLVLTLIVGWILGVFRNTIACLITIAAFRHSAGGGHSESPWRCALVTMTVFPLLALAARYVSMWEPLYLNLISLISITVGFALILIYAPVDSPRSLIISPIRRQRLKHLALIIMGVISIVILGLGFTGWSWAPEIRMCLALSVLWVSFNLTPWGHRFWCLIDGLGFKQERRCAD